MLWRAEGATEAVEGSAERQGVVAAAVAAATAAAASERGSAAPKEEAAGGGKERVGVSCSFRRAGWNVGFGSIW